MAETPALRGTLS